MTTTVSYPAQVQMPHTATAVAAAMALAAAIAGAALLGTIGSRADTEAPERPAVEVTQPITYPSIPEPIVPTGYSEHAPRFGGGSVAFRY